MKPMARPRRAGGGLLKKTDPPGRYYLLIIALYLAYHIAPVLWSGAER